MTALAISTAQATPSEAFDEPWFVAEVRAGTLAKPRPCAA